MYADDTAVIAKDSNDIQKAEKILEKMRLATNLKVNKSKCAAIHSFINQLTPPSHSLPVSQNPERYLGIWLTQSGLHYENKDILNKTFNLLARTKHIAKSLETKITLLKTYSLSKLNYLSNFVDLSKLCSQIEKTIDWFLYTNNSATRSQLGKKLLSKQREKLPKQLGGISRWDLGRRIRCQQASHIETITHCNPLFKKWWTNDINRWLSTPANNRNNNNNNMAIQCLKAWLKIPNAQRTINSHTFPNIQAVREHLQVGQNNRRKIKDLYNRVEITEILTINQS